LHVATLRDGGVKIAALTKFRVTDITYIRLRHGFVYLVTIMDWYSRKVLSWRISNTMEAEFCVACLEEALQRYGAPEIFNFVLTHGSTIPHATSLEISVVH